MNQLIISAATEGESVSPLMPNIWEMGVVLVGFAVLMYIVVKFVVPMFEKTFAERAEAIEGGIAKAEQAQADGSAQCPGMDGGMRLLVHTFPERARGPAES